MDAKRGNLLLLFLLPSSLIHHLIYLSYAATTVSKCMVPFAIRGQLGRHGRQAYQSCCCNSCFTTININILISPVPVRRSQSSQRRSARCRLRATADGTSWIRHKLNLLSLPLLLPLSPLIMLYHLYLPVTRSNHGGAVHRAGGDPRHLGRDGLHTHHSGVHSHHRVLVP